MTDFYAWSHSYAKKVAESDTLLDLLDRVKFEEGVVSLVRAKDDGIITTMMKTKDGWSRLLNAKSIEQDYGV